VISTLNETHLHRTLKLLYAERTGGKTELPLDGKICDIVTADGGVIEIQTGSVSNLAGKVAALVPRRRVRIVYPFVTQKIIQKIDGDGKTVSSRKSPKKQTVYSIFREITGLYPFLFHENFAFEAIPVVTREIRLALDAPAQSANNRRRRRLCWNKVDKELVECGEPAVFRTRADYLALLPFEAGEEFAAKDAILRAGAKNGAGRNDVRLMLWVMHKCGLIRFVRKEGNARIYSVRP
jgi:hypothetical protein